MKYTSKGIFFAILAAALYALNAPLSKLLLTHLPPTLMAGFLYLGAGIGMCVISCIRKLRRTAVAEQKLSKTELPYTLAMIALDIAAPVFLLLGLSSTTAANASLLNNFEITATALIALVVFKEAISPRLWCGIVCVTVSCALLSFKDLSSLDFSFGSMLILLACVCWGIENNCTRKLSDKDPLQIVLLKGVFSGLGSVIIGLCIGERLTAPWGVFATLCVGFVAYGLSIFFYVHAQRLLGAARTSAYYAVAPFIGTALSLAIFREIPPYTYLIALFVMIVGAWLCAKDEPIFPRKTKNKMKLYDISQEITTCEVYPGDPAPQKQTIASIADGELCNLTAFSMCAHNGTHIDAPFHFFQNGKTVDALPLAKTVGMAYVAFRDGILTADDAKGILQNAMQADPESAKRILIGGEAAVSLEAARVFADAKIDLLGNESQTVGPEDAPMEVHKILLSAETVLLEGIRLSRVPAGVCFLCAAPLSIAGADGAPCRAVIIR